MEAPRGGASAALAPTANADAMQKLQQIAALPDEEYEARAASVSPHYRELMDELRKRNQRAAVGVVELSSLLPPPPSAASTHANPKMLATGAALLRQMQEAHAVAPAAAPAHRADPKMLATGAALLKQMQEAHAAASAPAASSASTEPCGRPLIRLVAAKARHLEQCAVCCAAAEDKGAGSDRANVLERLQRILYSFGDAPTPPRASARLALEFVLAWQLAAARSAWFGGAVRAGRLSLPALQVAFPVEWREYELVEHGRRVSDASLEDGAPAAEPLEPLELPADQATLTATATSTAAAGGGGCGGGVAAGDGPSALRASDRMPGVVPGAGASPSTIEQRRRFADERTRAMSLDECALSAAECR